MAKPTDDSEVFLNQLIAQMQLHLQTVGGIFITVGTLVPVPLPIPGFKTWTGYTIPPSGNEPATPEISLPAEILANFDELVNFKPEELAVSNIASNKGYALPESTAIGTIIGGEVIKGNIKLEDVQTTLPDAKRKKTREKTPEVNPSQKIIECGNVSIKEPNASVIATMKQYGILTPIQRAHFLAQLAHESGNFYYTEEIASGEAYEGRADLGNTQPGDGKRYKGRGYIQLTGRANYTNYKKLTTDDVVSTPTLVAQKYYADVAGWFWKRNSINDLALDDTENSVLKVSIRINGKRKDGYPNGRDDRKKKFCGYWTKLKENPDLYT
jgi:predicted chitinase